MYAVIATGGKQYRVRAGDVLRVEKLDAEPGAEIELSALAVGGEGALRVGDEAAGAKVRARVRRHAKGRKIIVFKRKRRKNYRRTRGHRQWFTELEIIGIEA
ncbi:MAG: 50S ribosomal protein L21 [Zetaproteobacteria bacterium]|nr:MAG: 50S ribosomal protein L21 [Zetaproteobacteria bacterium]